MSKAYSGKDTIDSIFNNGYLDDVSTPGSSEPKKNRAVPKWGKKVLLVLCILLGCFILFELGSILYIYAVYPQKAERQHERDVKKAYENIAMADSTARALFSCEYASGRKHLSSYYDYIIDDCGICHFNHIEEGLAISYGNGWGVSQDLRKYYDWMVKSAEAGYHNGLLKLGDFYRDGVVVEEERLFESDLEKAKYYWGESAKRGNEEAKKRLETIY